MAECFSPKPTQCCFVSCLDESKQTTVKKTLLLFILQKFLHFYTLRSCSSVTHFFNHSSSSNTENKKQNIKFFQGVLSSLFSSLSRSFSKCFSKFLFPTLEISFFYFFFAFLKALGCVLFFFISSFGMFLDLTNRNTHNRMRNCRQEITVSRKGFKWWEKFLSVVFFSSFFRVGTVSGFSFNKWGVRKPLIISSEKHYRIGSINFISCPANDKGNLYSRDNLLYAVQAGKNTENSDFRLFPASRLSYPDLKTVISRGNSSWILNTFSVLERRLSPLVKKQNKKKGDILNDEKKEKDLVIDTLAEEEKTNKMKTITDIAQKNKDFDNGDEKQNQDVYILKPSNTVPSKTTVLSSIKQPPLISFHTAGNWKDKKKSWGKYKKNTGWRDPYRDGEDFHGFHPWRYFAEMFGGSNYHKKSEKPLFSGFNSATIPGKLNNEKSSEKTNIDSHEMKLVNMNTVMDVDMDLDVYADIMQEGVLGSIKSESGILYIRNTETPLEYYASENESEDKNEKEDPENLVERELYRSIRNYAHPRTPKF